MKPSLSLDYSSAAPLRGGVAVGWTLDVPSIERDPAFTKEARYRSFIDGRWKRLLKNTVEGGSGEHFRAEVDDQFARYTFTQMGSSGKWTVQTPDGITRVFEGQDAAHAQVWWLAKEFDFFGNQITYNWSPDAVNLDGTVYVGKRLKSIEWTSNVAAGLAAHARVQFMYADQELCGGVPVGAQLAHRYADLSTPMIKSGHRLTEIDVQVRDTAGGNYRSSRKYVLKYDGTELSCAGRSPLRFLTSVTETGYDLAGVAKAAPPVTFSYGPKRRELGPAVNLGAIKHGDSGTQSGARSTLMDMNGDGVMDRVWVEDGSRCMLKWQKGVLGGGATAAVFSISLPSAKWQETDLGRDFPAPSEHCTLGGQLARRFAEHWGHISRIGCREIGATVSYQFLDYNQDGLVDILVNLWESPTGTAGRDFPASNALASQRGEQPPCSAYSPQPESGFKLRVFKNQGNGEFLGLTSTSVDMTLASQIRLPYPLPPTGNEMTVRTTPTPALPTLADINGDGHLDIISFSQTYNTSAAPGLGSPYLYVWPGPLRTTGSPAPDRWPMPVFNPMPQLADPPSSMFHLDTTATLHDMDGDGLVDIVAQDPVSKQLVMLPNQLGRFGPPIKLGYSGPVENARAELDNWIGFSLRQGKRGFERRFVDIDVDGLPEAVRFDTGDGGIGAPSVSRLIAVLGRGSLSGSWLPSSAWDALRSTVIATAGSWYRSQDFVDFTGDGKPDLVSWTATGTATMFTDIPSTAPLRLLAAVDNGHGGRTRFEYETSTTAVSLQPSEHLAPRWVVRRVIVAPGFMQPERRSTYTYAGPRFGKTSRLDPSPDSFRGFAQVTVAYSGQQSDFDKRIVKFFDYDVMNEGDGGGRLVRELAYAVGGDGNERLEHRQDHTYVNRRVLYNDSQTSIEQIPSVTHLSTTIERSYKADGTEASTRRTKQIWSPRLNSSNVIAL
jgi:hypothetical protein